MANTSKRKINASRRRRGRPAWRPPDLKVVEQLAQRSMTIDEIAAALDVSRSTLFKKKKRSRELADAIRRGRIKGAIAVGNALFRQVKAGNITATIHMLEKGGWNKDETAYCEDPDHVLKTYKKKNRQEFRLLWRHMTTEERDRLAALLALAKERRKAVGAKEPANSRKGPDAIRPGNEDRPKSRPARRRTGRPRWSPTDLEVIGSLAGNGLTTRQIAQSLAVSKATVFRRIKDDEDFHAAITMGRARAYFFAADKLFQLALKGNVRALIFYAKTRLGWGGQPPRSITRTGAASRRRFWEKERARIALADH